MRTGFIFDARMECDDYRRCTSHWSKRQYGENQDRTRLRLAPNAVYPETFPYILAHVGRVDK